MKLKFFYTIIIIMLMLETQAQQRPHYSQYILNNYIFNPAISGIENYTDLKLSYRNQWVGFGEDAPKTFYLSIHGTIGRPELKKTATSFETPGENPRGKNYWADYTASEPHHGWGAMIVNDKAGVFQWTSLKASYAYHLGLTSQLNISAGFALGFNRITLDRDKVKFENPADPVLASGTGDLNKLKPDLDMGIWLYGTNFFAGASVQQLIQQKTNFGTSSVYGNGGMVPHWFGTAGIRFFMSDEISALPSAVVKYVSGAPTQVDANLKFQYLDRLWLGSTYRFNDGIAIMAGLNINSSINFSYAYDTRTVNGLLRSQQRGTHEIMIGFLIGNKYGDLCPRNVW